jgi:hypothetical protein
MSGDIEAFAGHAPSGRQIISVLAARRYLIRENGRCVPDEPAALQKELVYYPQSPQTGAVRPSLLQRDVDIYPWRDRTDVIVQGTLQHDRPIQTTLLGIELSDGHGGLREELRVTGDRWVERRADGSLRLCAPQPFTEMPLRYDKAYGGTDVAALAQGEDPDVDALLREVCDEDEYRELSDYSYPRNPAGKGYALALDHVDGLDWPNLEFPDAQLTLEALCARSLDWGQRPSPACFDWLPHAWFPRVAYFGDFPQTGDGKIPQAERALGLFDDDVTARPLTERADLRFAQGSHPRLRRRRFGAGLQLRVANARGAGHAFTARLPDRPPTLAGAIFKVQDCAVPPVLDLCFLELDPARVTLLWRFTFEPDAPALPVDWKERCRYQINWPD